ncbi:hypothetical protein FJQ54_17015 [Sandaracinobacter neustonicus]|uniref:Uncharacterized protein n=1 Tax=Sandaracinobacter neustonicus TaxID=1715348 RepID=A0A501XE23_9SPHN|nr:hypothetical protein [Sandaracinobacter neustonicus]TPE58746.1 hypothetical protein FJQ54_17015 [Sandaracinobacter neustonicus]
MSIRPIAGLLALSMAGSAQAGTSLNMETTALGAMLLLAALGSGLVVFALQERGRERQKGQEPVRIRQTIRRYNQP